MWPFDDWRRRREAVRLRQAFGRYIEPAMLERLLTHPEEFEPGLKPARIHFLLALVRDDDVEAVPGLVARAVEAIVASNGMVDAVSGSCVVGWFGVPLPGDAAAQPKVERAAAVARLLADLGSNVKIVTGDRDGLYGNIGGERRFNYGFVVPEFGRCLEALIKLDYGKAVDAGASGGGGSDGGG
jgi:hypothetical protein